MPTSTGSIAAWAALGRCALLGAWLTLAGCAATPPEPTPPSPPPPPPAVAEVAPSPHFKVGEPYQISGTWYYPEFLNYYEAIGLASWYGAAQHGLPTANGEIYDMHALTAAHPTLQLPSVVRVTNLANGRSLVLRVNDRGPFVKDRLIAVSRAAARELGFEGQGFAEVHVQYLGVARLDQKPIRPGEAREYASLTCDLTAPRRLVC